MSKSTTPLEEQKQRFRVGSRVFFEGMPGFNPNDTDEVEFEDNPRLYKNVMQFRAIGKCRCIFKWRRMTADEFVEYTLNSKLPMEIGKFLVPDVAGYVGITIDHLKRLAPVVDRLDEKHRYEKVIYDAYIENGYFYLTDEQRNKAYHEYARTRIHDEGEQCTQKLNQSCLTARKNLTPLKSTPSTIFITDRSNSTFGSGTRCTI
jgi:hypothetical protein